VAELKLEQPRAPGQAAPAHGLRVNRLLAILVLCVLSGAAGGGAVLSGLWVSGRLAPIAPTATTTPVTMQVPDVPEMLATLRPSVVSIEVARLSSGADGQPVVTRGAGTGFVIDTAGVIATNAHVVAGARQVQVTFSDGSVVPAAITGIATDQDLAVIKVQRVGLTPVRLGTSADLRVGEMVVAVGNALALRGSPTASLGIVSALDRSIQVSGGGTYQHLIQTDAAINSGDSGGPLVEADGQVIGINTAAASTAENIGFAIAIDEAAPILRQLSG
jgi:S1-C subfamily serine protease